MSSRPSSHSATESAEHSDRRPERRIAAFFDVDGTILDGNVVHAYAHLATQGMSAARRALWTFRFVLWLPIFLALDSVSRRVFNQVFYQHYRGLDVKSITAAARETFPAFGLSRLLPPAEKAVQRHQEADHVVVLVSGTTSFLAQPLADHLNVHDVYAAELEEQDGLFTGRLAAPPLSDERKAEVVTEFAGKREIDLAQSYAYGDSKTDVPMLRVVGNPVAVNPSRGLRAVARREGWPIEVWTR